MLIYYRLRDKSAKVRQDTILVLKHLVMNEMVKVRGQISELALCIIDTEANISGKIKYKVFVNSRRPSVDFTKC